jgi:hypothetical protein
MKNLLFGLFLLLATANVTAQTADSKTYYLTVTSNTAAMIGNYESFRVLLENENGEFKQGIWDAKYVLITLEGTDKDGTFTAYAAMNENLLVGSNPVRRGDKVQVVKFKKVIARTLSPHGPVIVAKILGKNM